MPSLVVRDGEHKRLSLVVLDGEHQGGRSEAVLLAQFAAVRVEQPEK